MEAWPEPVERVAAALRAANIEARVEEHKTATATAEEAAEAAGCKLGQIVKSLVFVADGVPALALVPGDRRADAGKVAALLGVAKAKVASADEVRTLTGFEPGAVAPLPLPQPTRILIDRALLTQPVVWIGAGSPRHVAALKPADLIKLTHAEAVDVAERSG
jgi:Cys-tRNA(Pro) deacylase